MKEIVKTLFEAAVEVGCSKAQIRHMKDTLAIMQPEFDATFVDQYLIQEMGGMSDCVQI